MDKIDGIPPGEYATERLNSAHTNLTKLVENTALAAPEVIQFAAVQAEMAKAAALLDVAAAIRESRATGYVDC